MHILLYHPPLKERIEDISYDTINYSSGVSGTETAMMELSKYLVDHGHQVTVAGIVKNKNTEHGIVYVPEDYLQEINFASVDVFCPIFYLISKTTNYIYNCLPRTCVIWVMAQCIVAHSEIDQLCKYFKVIIQCVSPWVRDKYPTWSDSSCKVIENAINPLFTVPITKTSDEKAGKWVFHASFERGGDVALRIFDKVRAIKPAAAQEMHIAVYYTPQIQEIASKAMTRPYIRSHGSLSKERLRNLLDDCDYFVYPLVLQNGSVHHDTYGCVILEAMARGVIVLSWDVACYESVYGTNMLRIEPIPFKTYERMGAHERNPALLSEEGVDRFTKLILYLEDTPKIKEEYRQKAMAWAHQQLWHHRGKDLEAWLQEHVVTSK